MNLFYCGLKPTTPYFPLPSPPFLKSAECINVLKLFLLVPVCTTCCHGPTTIYSPPPPTFLGVFRCRVTVLRNGSMLMLDRPNFAFPLLRSIHCNNPTICAWVPSSPSSPLSSPRNALHTATLVKHTRKPLKDNPGLVSGEVGAAYL